MMRPARCFGFLIVIAVCTAPSSRAAAQQTVPRFERSACDFEPAPVLPRDLVRECGHLVVLENRARPNGRTYRLAVVIYKAREPDGSPPLLLLHGGPGGNGGTRFPWRELTFPLARKRDIIAFDMRGVSASEPRLCRSFVADATPAFQLATRPEWEAGHRDAVRACVATLDTQGIDRTAFGADTNAADAIDLRRALGHAKWDVYGVSYGGLVVQELLQLDSAGLNSAAIVSSPVQGTEYAATWALHYQERLERIFAACAAQPTCHAAFPTLEQDFYTLYDEFNTKPVEYRMPGAAPPRTVLLNGERFLMELRRETGGPPSIARVPLLIHELRRGNRAAAIDRLMGGRELQPWDAIGRIVQCNEYGATYRRAVAAILPQLRPPFRTVADDFREHCDVWLPQPSRQADTARIASDVPTLILHGEYDPLDLLATQRQMMTKLTRAYAFTFPGEGHAGTPIGCHGSIVQQFLENPRRAPDSSCLALMPRVVFRTNSFAPTLTIAINARAASPFAGTWEVILGGGPDFTMQLQADGGVVRGQVDQGLLPVFDGRVANDTLRFKVKTSDSARVITFSATRQGDELRFTRAVETLSGGGAGQGIFGTAGPTALTARRIR